MEVLIKYGTDEQKVWYPNTSDGKKLYLFILLRELNNQTVMFIDFNSDFSWTFPAFIIIFSTG